MSTLARSLGLVVLGILVMRPVFSQPTREPVGWGPYQLPLTFVENRGQWPEAVKFSTYSQRLGAAVEDEAIHLWFPADPEAPSDQPASIRLSFEAASGQSRVEGEREQSTRYAFFRGSDPKAWRTGVVSYSSLLFRCLYDGIDLRLRAASDDEPCLEYDLLLEPGVDPDGIVIRCEGAEAVLQDDGHLLLVTPRGMLVQAPPVTWEELPGGDSRPLDCRFRVLGNDLFGFVVEGRDPSLPVVIDPRLTFLGGSGNDGGYALRVAPDGSVFVAGENGSFNVPTPPEQTEVTFRGMNDAFVAKLDPLLHELQWVANLGGNLSDRATDLEIASDGTVILVGYAASQNFPTTEGAYSTSHGGGRDAFVARLRPDPDLSAEEQLVYSTFIGGAGLETATGVALDANEDACVVGCTSSLNFPTVEGALERDYNGGDSDAFVCRVRLDGELDPEDQLLYSSYLGGNGSDCHPESSNIYLHIFSLDVDVDGDGTAMVAGSTRSTNFPTTPGALKEQSSGGFDVFLSRIRMDAALAGEDQLVASSLFGGSGDEWAAWVELDTGGNACFCGWTYSSDLPITDGARDSTWSQPYDTFATRVSPSLAELQYSTFIGAAGGCIPMDGALDSQDRIAVCGVAFTGSFPVTPTAYQKAKKGNRDGFLALLDPSLPGESQLVYSTFVGGIDWDEAWGMDFSPSDAAVLTGYTTSPDLLSGQRLDVYNPGFSGVSDFFVAVLDLRYPEARFSLSPEDGLPPLTVEVDASSSTTPEGTGDLTYSWDFRDGATAEGETASHTFVDPGRYRIELTVTNEVDNATTATGDVSVFCPPGDDVSPWTSVDLAEPTFPSTVQREGDGFAVCLGGAGFSGPGDAVHFVYRELSGDFRAVVRIDEVTAGLVGGGVGLMVRESLAEGARFAGLFLEKAATTYLQRFRYRQSTNARFRSGGTTELARWLRIERRGDVIIALGAADTGAPGPVEWIEIDRETFESLPESLFCGISGWGRDLGDPLDLFTPLQARLSGLDVVPVTASFVRGDANSDDLVDISDAVTVLDYLFVGGPAPPCLDSADADDNGVLDITDPIYILSFLFLGGLEPRGPFPDCGPDPTPDALRCDWFEPCEEL